MIAEIFRNEEKRFDRFVFPCYSIKGALITGLSSRRADCWKYTEMRMMHYFLSKKKNHLDVWVYIMNQEGG
ncbi:hypothetical protein HMPREF9088_0617 [Enterococcus italicus DSM 15952]|uniref:Uncharacterized protein n=1 Tax=Enterococcus italicus (strain DSM 15952 / CCUG 50447 / LMG 22039 / TP 1.5) TaxID=888064 RepID=E6LE27_ENTI1|nr:hypothetical protein HMPREF9088_0617 [Enterococcus italicus DSM 15952]